MFYKLIGESKGIFNLLTIIELIISLLFITFGLVSISNPVFNVMLISIIIGLLVMCYGVNSIYSYIKRGSISLFNNNLIYGIVFILIGVVVLFVKNFLSVMLGIYFLVSSIQKINYGLVLKKFNEQSWLITVVLGICFIVIGIISFFTNNMQIIEVVGICSLGFGLMNMISIILFRKRSKFFIS